MPRRAICAGMTSVISSPLKKICPDCGARNLVSRLKTVVLPAPFGPINAWMLPRRTRRSRLSTATNPANPLTRPRVSTMYSELCPRLIGVLMRFDTPGHGPVRSFDRRALALAERPVGLFPGDRGHHVIEIPIALLRRGRFRPDEVHVPNQSPVGPQRPVAQRGVVELHRLEIRDDFQRILRSDRIDRLEVLERGRVGPGLVVGRHLS